MHIFSEIIEFRDQIKLWKKEGKSIGFVPTMGNLHEGHLTLVRKARENSDIVVVSIFVNPLQFDNEADLEAYPITLESDLSKLDVEGVHAVFTPTAEVMYPDGLEQQTFVEVPSLSHILEGALRPGHFRGVATVVTKLFNIVQPDIAFFGKKDFQQLAMIRQMIIDMAMNIRIIGVATVRETDGLAMSSRNGYLTLNERQRAPVLARTMRWIGSQIRSGKVDFDSLIEDASDQLRAADLQPDDIYIRDAVSLKAVTEESKKVVILMSANLGKARLIDNHELDLTAATEETAE
ncbi:MAG: pantoate--beta-alanine ligase [Aliivibrio sp.]|uniref:pantoate--beta-alanine ligase n=1 Tax=Aliivibrio sp. TaxID=1872443 RepID=UPI001A50ACA1|nr:pantoate--beta-alanine ligase [Aliivibrio sp.]